MITRHRHRHLPAAVLCLAAISPGVLATGASAAPARSMGAGDEGQPARPPHCKPSIDVSSREVGAGETVAVSGALTCREGEEPTGQAVTLYEHVRGSGTGMQPVAEATAAADGSYELTSPPIDETTVFLVRTAGGHSVRVRVVVTAHLSFALTPAGASPALADAASSFSAHSAVSFSGTVTPADASMVAVLQRERPAASGRWRRVSLAPVAADGSYSITHSFARPGEAVLRVIVRRHGLLVAVSESSSFQILARVRTRTPPATG